MSNQIQSDRKFQSQCPSIKAYYSLSVDPSIEVHCSLSVDRRVLLLVFRLKRVAPCLSKHSIPGARILNYMLPPLAKHSILGARDLCALRACPGPCRWQIAQGRSLCARAATEARPEQRACFSGGACANLVALAFFATSRCPGHPCVARLVRPGAM